MNYWGEKAQLSLTMIKGAMSVTFSNVWSSWNKTPQGRKWIAQRKRKILN